MAFSSTDISLLIGECLSHWKSIKPRQLVLDYLANEVHELGTELVDVKTFSQDKIGHLIVMLGRIKGMLQQYSVPSCATNLRLRACPCLSRPTSPRDLLVEMDKLRCELRAELNILDSVSMRAQIPNFLSMLALRAVVSKEKLLAAVTDLAVLAIVPECGRMIAESGGISLLVKAIKRGRPACQVQAIRALGNLALSCPEQQVSIAQLHGMKAIVDKLFSRRCYREQGLCAVANLSDLDGRNLERVWRKVFPLLIRMLEKGYPVVWRLHAARTLAGLARHEKLHGALVDNGMVPQMLSILDSNDPVLANLGVRTLTRISFIEPYCQLIRATNGIEAFVKILSNEPYRSHYAEGALCVLANMAGLKDCDVQPWENAISTLITCGESQGPACLRNSVLALSSLSRSPFLQDIIHKRGGLPALVNWLSSDDMACKERSCVCLANMAMTGDLQRLLDFDHAGGVSALVNVMETGNAVCREQALRVLACMSSQRFLQEVLFMRGVVTPTLDVLVNGWNSQKCMLYATYTLANLCCVRECVEEVKEENVEAALRRIARSKHEVTSKNAMVVLQRLAGLNGCY